MSAGPEPQPVNVSRAALLACALVLAALGLGVFAPGPAAASCAGPQLALEQGGTTVAPRRVGQGDREAILYDIGRDRPLRVNGSNLTFDCQDTASASPRGCGAPVTDPVKPLVPMQAPEVVLTQRGRSWILGRVGVIGPDLTAQVVVDLPRAVRPGRATLSLRERRSAIGAQLELVIT